MKRILTKIAAFLATALIAYLLGGLVFELTGMNQTDKRLSRITKDETQAYLLTLFDTEMPGHGEITEQRGGFRSIIGGEGHEGELVIYYKAGSGVSRYAYEFTISPDEVVTIIARGPTAAMGAEN